MIKKLVLKENAQQIIGLYVFFYSFQMNPLILQNFETFFIKLIFEIVINKRNFSNFEYVFVTRFYYT